jgi:hypothetical protein
MGKERDQQKNAAVVYPFHQSDILLSSAKWGPPDELAFRIEMSGLFRSSRFWTRNPAPGSGDEKSSIVTATRAIVDAFQESASLTIDDMADVGGVDARRCYDIAHVLDWAGLITKRTGPSGAAYRWIGGKGTASLAEVRQMNEQLRAEVKAMDGLLQVLEARKGSLADRLIRKT